MRWTHEQIRAQAKRGGVNREQVEQLLAEVERLREENADLRIEAAGLTVDGRTVPDLEAEAERLTSEVKRLRSAMALIADHTERDEPPQRTAAFARSFTLDQENNT